MWTIREDVGWEGEAPRPIPPSAPHAWARWGRVPPARWGLGSVSGAEALAPRGRPPKEPCGDDTESVVVYTWVYNSVHTGTQVCTRVYTLYPLVGRGGRDNKTNKTNKTNRTNKTNKTNRINRTNKTNRTNRSNRANGEDRRSGAFCIHLPQKKGYVTKRTHTLECTEGILQCPPRPRG